MPPPLLDIMILIGFPKEKEIPWGVNGKKFFLGGEGRVGAVKGKNTRNISFCVFYTHHFFLVI